jgi:putative membrane protein
MVDEHEADIADFEKEASEGQVGQVRQFASETLPTLKGHLDKARELQKTVMAAAI